jgi:hypothetical protein
MLTKQNKAKAQILEAHNLHPHFEFEIQEKINSKLTFLVSLVKCHIIFLLCGAMQNSQFSIGIKSSF